jgi:hypothetical protein
MPKEQFEFTQTAWVLKKKKIAYLPFTSTPFAELQSNSHT